MRISEAARVGLATVAAFLLLAVATFGLRGSWSRHGTYRKRVSFTDAQGIQEGAYVRVRGVDVGTVERVALDSTGNALLTLRISRDYPLSSQDAIRIISSIVGFTPPYVEITPGGNPAPVRGNPDVLAGQPTPNSDDIMAKSDQLLGNLNTLTQRMNHLAEGLTRVVDDPKVRSTVSQTAENFHQISASGVVIAGNMERATARADELIGRFQTTTAQLDRTLRQAQGLMGSFHGTAAQAQELMKDTRAMVKDTHGVVQDAGTLVRNTNKVVENAGGLVADTRSTLTENREKLKNVLDNLNTSLKQLDATLADAHSFLADPELRGNLKDTARNVKDATENLKGITADVRNITGDPKVQSDLKVTVNRLRDVTEQASDVLQRVREVVGTSGKTAKTIGQRISEVEITSELLHATRADRTRIDFDATIPWSQNTFYRLGIFDFGEGNKFNIQAGQQVRSGIWARYGIHASKLGGGLDFGPRAHPIFSLDLFGVDRPRLDATANLRLLPYLDLTLGVDHLFDRADPVVGVRYHNR